MFRLGRRLGLLFAEWTVLAFLLAGTATAVESLSVSLPEDPAQLLKQADGAESSNLAEFTALMRRLNDSTMKLSPQQQLYRRYLMARQVVFSGDFNAAIPLMTAISDQSADPILSFRAGTTVVDLLVTQSRYDEAFARLDPLLEQLPNLTDPKARIQALGVAAQLYFEAGQYDLAVSYADRLLQESTSNKSACIGWYYKIEALSRGGNLQASDKRLRDATDACNRAGDILIADMFKSVVANIDIQRGLSTDAINLLEKNYEQAEQKHFSPLTSDFDGSLAQAYWNTGDVNLAKKFALLVVDDSKETKYLQSMVTAYRVLYEIEKKKGDMSSALTYLEKYMATDKGYLNDVSAKALAYQTVKQQVLAKKLQIDTLNKQNEILKLQQKLTRKAAEASRLYIVLLLIALTSIGLWTYRVKRSQLRFMKLARRDGLTGIFNRQHFVNEAELQLQYCRKSSREASLVLIDLDHFKAVNDNHGHAVGDRVLKRAVDACESHLRSTDIFGRLGGEEFGILLPECTLEQAAARAEQIRQAIAAASAEEDATSVSISASFGVASTAQSGYELRQLLIHADEALYQAKREGRNRVNISDSLQESLRMA
jgi:diguanylate cyclase (GGDEF)-like protein